MLVPQKIKTQLQKKNPQRVAARWGFAIYVFSVHSMDFLYSYYILYRRRSQPSARLLNASAAL